MPQKLNAVTAAEVRLKYKAGISAVRLSKEYGCEESYLRYVGRGQKMPPRLDVLLDDETILALDRLARRSSLTVEEFAARALRALLKK